MSRLLAFLVVTFSFVLVQAQNSRSPVQGDDLLQLLGKRRTAEQVDKFNKFIGNKELKEDISFLNYGKGIQVNFKRSIVMGIDLYNGNNRYSEEFKKFPGDLPLGMSFENTIYQVKQKLGEGYKEEGELTSTYNLTKSFKLNDDDDYTISIEFYSGKMNRVSIIYVEGGSTKEAEDDRKPGKKGFSGHDFFIMIKKNKFNRELKMFTELLDRPDYHDRTQQLYINEGVDIRFNESGHISSITLYSGGQRSSYKEAVFGPYTLKLPYGIKMSNSREAIIKKAGNPRSDGGSMITYHEGFADMQIAFSGGKIDHVKFLLAEESK